MDGQLKTRWVEALRSGKYRQGREALRTRVVEEGQIKGYVYCCLGVLCDLIEPNGWDEAQNWYPEDPEGDCIYSASLMFELLPIEAAVAQMLMQMNDAMNRTAEDRPAFHEFDFDAIADYIEGHQTI